MDSATRPFRSATTPFRPAPGYLTGREHRLGAPPTLLARLGIKAQTLLESGIARVSRLPDRPVYETSDFPWVRAVEQHWRDIRAELEAVLEQRAALPNFQDILAEVGTITADDRWKTFWLVGAGLDCEENARRCPQTMRALRHVPGVINAFFSILAPDKQVPAHRGAYNGILRYHLGLIVPEPREQAGIRIADRVCHWREGESLVFDDSFNHEAWNFTGGWRVVLFVDFPRPLRQPFDALNRLALRSAALLPLMRRAGRRHREWQRRFYPGGP